VLHQLRHSETDEVPVDTLIEAISQRERLVTKADRDSVGNMLYHAHLPMLNDAGVVDFNKQRNMIQYKGHPILETLFESSVQLTDDTVGSH
jgi:hypothetical protein